MTRHFMWESVPHGYRWYVTDPVRGLGVWLWLPVYKVAVTWRNITIAYLHYVSAPLYRWKIRRLLKRN